MSQPVFNITGSLDNKMKRPTQILLFFFGNKTVILTGNKSQCPQLHALRYDGEGENAMERWAEMFMRQKESDPSCIGNFGI